MAGDDEHWKPEDGIPHRLLYENGASIGPEEVKRLLQQWVSHGRLFLDFRADHSPDDLNRIDGLLGCRSLVRPTRGCSGRLADAENPGELRPPPPREDLPRLDPGPRRAGASLCPGTL